MLITLGFILLITVISVAFLVRSRSSLQTSQSYSREMIAKEVGEIGINAIVAQFQKEIAVARTNGNQMLLPPRIGVTNTNPRNSALIRRTTGDTAAYNTSYTSTSYTYPAFASVPVPNLASTVSTAIPAKNGWTFATNRWEAPKLLRTGETFTAPDWVYVDDQGPTKTASKNIIGRFASTVYDVGGLLDINEVGVPASVPKGDKGSTAFADLSALPGGASLTIGDWRGSGASIDDYYGNSTVTDPKLAGRIESPAARQKAGDNRFFSRMELVEAAKAGSLGLSETLLPYFRTRSEAANRLSVENVYDNYDPSTRASDLVPLSDNSLKATQDTTFTVDRIDGSTETYTIKAGQPLLQNRFPLARLRWLADREADGTPRHQAEIKKYFGLTWNPAGKLFIYTSPDSNTAVSSIKTLSQWVAQVNGSNTAREPDFFEWLKAGINPDSLGQTGGTTDRIFSGYIGTQTPWEISNDLHILRIGANIIDQSDPDSIPTGIRSAFTDVDPTPFDSFGQENLPYLNEVITAVLRNGNHLNGYLQFEMWNPARNAATQANPPLDYQGNEMRNFRVRATQGRVLMEPHVYMESGHNYKPLSGPKREAHNTAWSVYKAIVNYSRQGLQISDFNAPDLTSAAVTFNMDSPGDFFAEPYLANGGQPNGQDKTHAVTMDTHATIHLPGVLGAPPVNGQNAMLVCSVNAPNPAFSGLLLQTLYKDPDTADNFDGGSTFYKDKIPSSAKAFNAATFNSDGTTASYGVSTQPVTLAVELKDNNNVWHTCQIYNNLALGIRPGNGDGSGKALSVLSSDLNTKNESRWNVPSDTTNSCFGNWDEWQIRKGYPNTDPRTERFGLTDQHWSSPGMSIRTHTDPYGLSGLAWNLANGLNTPVGTDFTKTITSPVNEGPAEHWTLYNPGTSVSVLADLATNYQADNTHSSYTDTDNVLRPADARWAPADAHPALPVATFPNALNSRPVILDRPFRSVAELGCVFRDIPWKSLDLFSPDSADRRLLDVFSIEDRATVTGKINPNLTTVETLKALVRGASLDPSNAGASSVPDTNANAVAAIFSGLNPMSDPIHSSANMTARLATNAASKPGGGFSPYKTQAENFIRALASTMDTRSWQLMLDVVAQSGRVAPGSSDLKDFVVEGQRRFFVYLTLDRITGEIVDKHIEPVYE